MSKSKFFWLLVSILIVISICLCVVYYFIFPDLDSVLQDLAASSIFLPIEVIVIVIIIDRIISKRDTKQKLSKLNVVAGAFFSETGNQIMENLISANDDRINVFHNVGIKPDWTNKDFNKAMSLPITMFGNVNIQNVDLKGLHKSLEEDRSFLLVLLGNQTLLEHERFTDMLLAVFHLTEELESRTSLDGLPEKDLQHISIDVNRAYQKLVVEWLDYMSHIKTDYPFLYSLNLRIHPFQKNPSPIVK